jgi:hypothetical protein
VNHIAILKVGVYVVVRVRKSIPNVRGFVMKYANAAFIMFTVLFSACGGGGGGGDGGGARSKFNIDTPVRGGGSYTTTDYSVKLAGDGFLYPDGADCKDTSPQDIDITWVNNANGVSGDGNHSGGCLCDMFGCVPYNRWVISHGLIPLELGNNKIKVTGSAPGKSQSASITVIRQEGSVSISFSSKPENMTPGRAYELAVTVRDAMDNPIPDQVIEWRSSEQAIAAVAYLDLPTDHHGIARAEATAQSPGVVEISAFISGADISTTESFTVVNPQSVPSEPPAEIDECEGVDDSLISLRIFEPDYLACGEVSVNGVVTTDQGVITSIEWDWGDGSTETSWFPAKHRYAHNGSYIVTVTGISSSGNCHREQQQVDISGTDDGGCSEFIP